MIRDYISLSFDNLKHRGIRSWLTMLGIFIGIAAVVSLISLGNGLQEAITGQFASLSTDKLTIQSASSGYGPPGAGAARKLTEHDMNVIKSVEGINMVVPRLIRVAKVEYNKVAEFDYIASMPDDQKQVDMIYEAINIKVDSGRLLTAGDRGKIVLGSNFLKNDNFGKPLKTGSSLKIQEKNYEVIGILKTSSTFQVNMAILMNEKDMKDALDIGDEIDIIVAQVENENEINDVGSRIEEKMRKDRKQKKGEEDFSVQTPIKALGTVNLILSIINLIVTGIAAISLIVGGIGIMNTMYTSVLERTKEIGIMKAVGARNSDVMKIFLIESGLLGLVGGIVGAVIGLLLAFGVSGAANAAFGSVILKVTLSWPLLLLSIAFSLIIGVVSGISPAIQASKLKPVEALRK